MRYPIHQVEGRTEDGPFISVVICTHNRADYLERAIRSLTGQAEPQVRHEILVVDNGSTDNTREVVRQFDAAGNIRYVFEPKLGLCHARNTGWRQARGQVVAYLDDDAIACSGWLAAIKEAFESTPNVGVVGGRVEPIWEADRPDWLSDEIALSLTILDWSPTPKLIKDLNAEWLVGANMAVPTALLAELGGFHPWLDRMGQRMLSSGDVFLQKQIAAKGYACLYYPKMSVEHLVPKSRLEKRWFIRRYYSQGLSDAIMRLIDEQPLRATRLRLALSMVGRLLGRPAALRSLIVPTDDSERFRQKCYSLITIGHIAGLLGALGR